MNICKTVTRQSDTEDAGRDWKERLVSPDEVIKKIRPGMNIFIGTGVAEPRTLVRTLMNSDAGNLRDLVLVQLFSFGDAISLEALRPQKYRLKTFFSGWVASEAINSGQVDLIPSRFVRIPELIGSRRIPIEAAFIQITPPDEDGYCSLGVAIDVALEAMEQASIVVGEINPEIPRTFGDTFVPVSEFDLLVQATEPPIYFKRWPVDDIFDRVAANVASVIEDGSCLAFSIGPLFDALPRHLAHKRHLGIHTAIFTDALMELVKSGAVSNRYKGNWRGKSVTSYALGTPELLKWLDRNPLVEFQGVDKVFDPFEIAKNCRFVTVLPARKADLSGRIALHVGKASVGTNPAEATDFFNGAEMSPGGITLFALPSRNLKQEPNILISVEQLQNQFTLKESVDMVVTEYGVAWLEGRTVRERAQALIDIAHPGDREALVRQAKAQNIIYPDQIWLAESAHLYPAEISTRHTFKNNTEIQFRAIRPSDEEEMRHLFYRFSDESVYYRYFAPIQIMPHAKMQSYVNIDYCQSLSVVGLADDPDPGRIIAEGRYVREPRRPYAEVAFVVDETYQGLGIATYLYQMLIRLARERGLKGFTASVLPSNRKMLKVFEKGGPPVKASLSEGVYELTIPFDE
ncbi:GCN5 family acetyltransferase [Desulfonema ishimotonii]|uniref:GCN5 family acetyltransferase n=1 Tax=Desulfonema ishimotonii TaxID=45657 RepID=A0A401FRK3_9BACT|nr:bifunctional acetyl-CoA hydrolase/transferase family protein/GNAT family N-acetyltransferase [Desulfonema ishimotonii]GBC59591.1 GCN5 family acetyltransferase [Desulfonema ishimotonii]